MAAAPCRLVLVAGDKSGVGKSSLCLGLLGTLLSHGYEPSSLAYIKPCTQCEDVQLVSKWCESKGIAHCGIGPIRFYQGFTSEVIDGKAEPLEARHQRIKEAVSAISQGKKLCLVDGVGYAAVGSVAGVSNAEVAAMLGAPVVIVGRPGIGNAIDSFNMLSTFVAHHGATVLGAVFNNIPQTASYHTFESCRTYVEKYFNGHVQASYYGSIPRNDAQWQHKLQADEKTGGVACVLRETQSSLQMSETESTIATAIVQNVGLHFNIDRFLQDLQSHYSSRI